MKIFKSIKWRLQIWYGLILVAVLAGFGFTAYQLERGRQFRRIDDELQQRFDLLARLLHAPPRGRQPGEPPFDRSPPDQRPDGPPDQDFDAGPPGDNLPPREFHLPADQAYLFGMNNPNDFYFVAGRDGHELARSTNAPSKGMFYQNGILRELNRHPEILTNGNIVRMRGIPSTIQITTSGGEGLREIRRDLPSGEVVLVGCSITPELKELRLTAFRLACVGGIILFFGLAGGWWFVGRALRPISQISSTAIKISAGDLSQRINVAETESELGQLAAVLNATFARLEAAFAQQQQFTSDAAHELRTPVSVMLTQTQTALNRERSTEDYKQTVEACQRAAQRMRKLIESLLALARLDAGQEVLKRLKFDFSKTIADCAELVKPLADERRVKILTEVAPLEITGDSERLAQVVTNLLTNAIQYNKSEGEVRVKLESENGLAILKVSDTGQGIAAEDLPRVFERFYRADSSRTGAGNAGLGLAISKAVVEAHGGTIEVSSKENIGTVFVVRLPV